MWTLTATKANLACPTGSLRIDVSRPQDGVVVSPTRGETEVFWKIAQLAGSELVECYTRAEDLVATYKPTDAFPFRSQLYWTCVDDSDTDLAVQFTISAQTDLLDTHPVMDLSIPQLPLSRARSADECYGRICELAADHILLLAVHPSDAPLNVGHSGDEWQIFGEFLEKGVIRRARLFAALLSGSGVDDRVQRVLERFRNQELPLTA